MSTVQTNSSHDAAGSSHGSGTSKGSFPRHIMMFPRTRWDGVIFSYPNFRPGELRLKAIWASRAASDKFLKAFKSKDKSAVDEVDFAVAVLAKAAEMNEYIRLMNRVHSTYYPSTEAWLRASNLMIDRAFEVGWEIVNRCLPDLNWNRDDLLPLMAEFVRPAMNCFWRNYTDCILGLRPANTWYDEDTFTDRYLPEPGDPQLCPRPLVRVNFTPGAEREIKWVDYKGDRVPTPQWYIDEEAERIKKQEAEQLEAEDAASEPPFDIQQAFAESLRIEGDLTRE